MKTLISAAAVAALLSGAAQAGTLTTTWAGGNGQDGAIFDVTVGALDILVTGFDLSLYQPAGSASLEFWVRDGSAETHLGSSAGWTLHDSFAGILPAGPAGAFWDVADLSLAAGSTSGFYLTVDAADDNGVNYTDGAGGWGEVVASDAYLSILQGVGKSHRFGNTYAPRIWNGTVFYDVGGLESGESAAIPVPGALPLAAAAMGALGLVGRRRRG